LASIASFDYHPWMPKCRDFARGTGRRKQAFAIACFACVSFCHCFKFPLR
jgi:hypothetical protein